ncbi:MAG TPA: family 20 glycosylhydrolase [Bacteroidales bacterium]|nr:family 20 glycosylhydrolase [Bacteroidales bacterium]
MNRILTFILLPVCSLCISQTPDSGIMVRGFCIAIPQPEELSRFIAFMENDLAPNGINTLILRTDFNYEYECYPNLRNREALTSYQVKQLVQAARKNNIRLIPQINLLGHQSWAEHVNILLREYPQFDETPGVKMPEKYTWPNEDSLYCKSYCPLHPQIHEVIFALIDEIMDSFEADAFHAGMDEVFYIGDDSCPRCSGKNKAELFAGEVIAVRNHLASKNKGLWIWGDRLLDGKTTGLGIWEASENDTWKAIDLIPRDVVICDWHYDRAEPTAAIFASKGFNVIACYYNKQEVAVAQMQLIETFRLNSNNVLRDRFLGIMQTIWSPAGTFLDIYDGEKPDEESMGPVQSFREMIRYIRTKEPYL